MTQISSPAVSVSLKVTFRHLNGATMSRRIRALAISRAFGKSVDWLLTGEEKNRRRSIELARKREVFPPRDAAHYRVPSGNSKPRELIGSL